MVGIDGLGMLQNACSAGTTRDPDTSELQLEPSGRKATITRESLFFEDDKNADVGVHQVDDDVRPLKDWLVAPNSDQMARWLDSMETKDGAPDWLEPVTQPEAVIRVHGALKELEQWVPGAGLAMIQVFFPTSFVYDDSRVRDNINKKFWKRASRTRAIRRRAEQVRREATSKEHAVSGP